MNAKKFALFAVTVLLLGLSACDRVSRIVQPTTPQMTEASEDIVHRCRLTDDRVGSATRSESQCREALSWHSMRLTPHNTMAAQLKLHHRRRSKHYRGRGRRFSTSWFTKTGCLLSSDLRPQVKPRQPFRLHRRIRWWQ